jgi:hypothetical protein
MIIPQPIPQPAYPATSSCIHSVPGTGPNHICAAVSVISWQEITVQDHLMMNVCRTKDFSSGEHPSGSCKFKCGHVIHAVHNSQRLPAMVPLTRPIMMLTIFSLARGSDGHDHLTIGRFERSSLSYCSGCPRVPKKLLEI